jgi:hypothetical protein
VSTTPASPAASVVLTRRGEEKLARGDLDGALADAEQALADDLLDGSARLLRGRALALLGHAAAAKADFDLVPILAPNRVGDLPAAAKR